MTALNNAESSNGCSSYATVVSWRPRGDGLVAVAFEEKWDYGIQLLLTRKDGTEARLQISLDRHGGHNTRLLSPEAVWL